jgi:hypothetical protein
MLGVASIGTIPPAMLRARTRERASHSFFVAPVCQSIGCVECGVFHLIA